MDTTKIFTRNLHVFKIQSNRAITRFSVLILALFCLTGSMIANSPSEKWGDMGDGTYRNFVFWSEFSNPDVIKVGEDFYMTTSTLHLSPNIAIYKSKDAVNWQIVGHVVSDVTQFSKKYGFDRMEDAGNGSWATSIRYHDGRFWVHVIDPTEGLFMSSAKSVEGPWEPLYKVSAGMKMHDDGCPLWDEDGNAYFSCSDFSKKSPDRMYTIKIFKMSADGKKLLDEGVTVHRGVIAESTKLYKRNGFYYLMYTEEPGRQQWIMRSNSIYGPYEKRIILQNFKTDAYRPVTQGALVDIGNNKWIYLGQSNCTTVWGWPLALLSVTWKEDWPMVGEDFNGDGIGEMIWHASKPIAGFSKKMVQSTDEFQQKMLQPQWEFNFQPMPGAYSLTAHPGFLRMNAFSTLNGKSWNMRNVLLQRMIGREGVIDVKMDLRNMRDGQSAGVCGYGKQRARLYVELNGEKNRVVKYECERDTLIMGDITGRQKQVWFRISHNDTHADFSYSMDGKVYKTIGKPYKLSTWNWVGARFGLFTFNNKSDMGSVDFDYFRYEYK